MIHILPKSNDNEYKNIDKVNCKAEVNMKTGISVSDLSLTLK